VVVSEKLGWSDAQELAERLLEKLPDVDPLSIRFTDLHRWICELPDFAGDPKASTEKHLEAIQMAWYEAWLDRKQDSGR